MGEVMESASLAADKEAQSLAKAGGLKRYQGRQCDKPGHGSWRYVSGGCVDCNAERTARSRGKEVPIVTIETVAESFDIEWAKEAEITSTWTMTPAAIAAAEWEPPNWNILSPDGWVLRVRELLANGQYRMVVAADGHSFVGTPDECGRHMLSREAYLSAYIVNTPAPKELVTETEESH